MFVLGIDPGVSRCGYACIQKTSSGPHTVAIGVIRTSPADELPQRLAELQRELRSLFDDFTPDALAIERVLFQNNARTAMSVGQASGLAMAEAASRNIEVAQYSPNEAKLAVAGHGGADKVQMQQMVKTLLKLDVVPKPADAADAAALALCHLAHLGLRRSMAAGATRKRGNAARGQAFAGGAQS
ncbi:MAG TPA: crossover junction endodeoxyribonuclease RuvC [Acidimicrobiales bacterium]|nr:crossover junction endodeoxyribonuclease RuvC [Acidimicrobiales bacterium]